MNARKALEELYSEASLEKLLYQAARTPNTRAGDWEFAEYHSKRVAGIFEGVYFDFLTVSVLRLDDDWNLEDIDCVHLNLPDSVLTSYEKYSEFDTISPPVYKNAGRIVSCHDVHSDDVWTDSYFYRMHCQPYDIRRTLMIAFRHPTYRGTMVAFDYLAAPSNDSWEGIDKSILEYASFVFALAWLYRKNAMDEGQTEYCFRLLHSLTLTQLSYLRKYANSPHQARNKQAADLGVRTRTFKDGLQLLRRKVADRSRWQDERVDSTEAERSLRVLDADYHFLRLLGDHTKPLIL